jgi:hypothetical protein
VVPEDGQGTVGSGSITRDNLQKLENASVCFAPNIQFLENLDLFYKDDGVTNLNPYNHLIQSPPSTMNATRINFSSIGKVAEVSEQTAAFVLRQLIQAIMQAVKKEISLKINMKVGHLKISGSG